MLFSVLLSLIFFPFVDVQTCNSAKDGFCVTNSTIESFDIKYMQDISSGSCDFQNTLCSYKQRCFDDADSVWKTNNAFASIDNVNFTCYYHRSILQSPFLCISDAACLQFHATVLQSSSLEVYLENANGYITPILQTSVTGTDQNILHVVSLERSMSRILFSGMISSTPGAGNNTVRLKSVSIGLGSCTDTNNSRITNPRLTYSTTSATKSCTVINNTPDFQEDGNNSVIIGAIVGSVIAILAVLAIVIIVLVSWKKRTRAHKGSDSNETHLNKNCQQQQPNTAKDLYTDDKQFEIIKTLAPVRLDETVTTDISTKRNNRPYAPIEVDQHHSHAYDLIPENGISRKIPLEEFDHYDLAGTTNEFNMHSLSNGNNSSNFNRLKQAERPDYSTVQINKQNHGITDETVDEYNRIELENHTSKKESESATLNAHDMLQSKVPAYSLVQKSSHIPKVTNETVDEYNRIDLENHTSKKESVSANLNARDRLQSKVPAYSSVQKSSHIPKVTNETVDEYNRIDKERHIYGKEPTSNVYNKLKSPLCDIPSNCNNESLKPVMDMPQNDYNKLDYKQNHRNQPANDKGEEIEDECSPTLKAYSSVGNHTDTYARVHSDKKDNIIASDYDHIV